MKKYTYKFPISFFLNIIFLVLPVFIIYACSPKEYIQLDKEVLSIMFEEDSCYFKFTNDDNEYVCHNIQDKNLETIKQWDSVTIWVEDDYEKYDYGLIYQLEFEDTILYSDIDQYEEDNKIISNIAYLVLISIIIVSITYLFTGLSKIKEVKEEFCLKEANYTYYLFVLTLTISLVPIISILVYYFKSKISEDTLGFIFVFLIFLIPSIFGLYWAFVSKFEFKNNTYYYKNAFLKLKKASLQDIKKVEFKTNLWGLKVQFYNHNDEKIMGFYDHGFIFKKGLFINSLLNHNIEFSNKELNQVQEVMIYTEMAKGNDSLAKTYRFKNIDFREKAIYIKRILNEKIINYKDIALIKVSIPQNRSLSKSDEFEGYHCFTFFLKNDNIFKLNCLLTVNEALQIITFLKEKEVIVETEYYNNVIDNTSYSD